jgi:hypothetical protein
MNTTLFSTCLETKQLPNSLGSTSKLTSPRWPSSRVLEQKVPLLIKLLKDEILKLNHYDKLALILIEF